MQYSDYLNLANGYLSTFKILLHPCPTVRICTCVDHEYYYRGRKCSSKGDQHVINLKDLSIAHHKSRTPGPYILGRQSLFSGKLVIYVGIRYPCA